MLDVLHLSMKEAHYPRYNVRAGLFFLIPSFSFTRASSIPLESQGVSVFSFAIMYWIKAELSGHLSSRGEASPVPCAARSKSLPLGAIDAKTLHEVPSNIRDASEDACLDCGQRTVEADSKSPRYLERSDRNVPGPRGGGEGDGKIVTPVLEGKANPS